MNTHFYKYYSILFFIRSLMLLLLLSNLYLWIRFDSLWWRPDFCFISFFFLNLFCFFWSFGYYTNQFILIKRMKHPRTYKCFICFSFLQLYLYRYDLFGSTLLRIFCMFFFLVLSTSFFFADRHLYIHDIFFFNILIFKDMWNEMVNPEKKDVFRYIVNNGEKNSFFLQY